MDTDINRIKFLNFTFSPLMITDEDIVISEQFTCTLDFLYDKKIIPTRSYIFCTRSPIECFNVCNLNDEMYTVTVDLYKCFRDTCSSTEKVIEYTWPNSYFLFWSDGAAKPVRRLADPILGKLHILLDTYITGCLSAQQDFGSLELPSVEGDKS